MFKTGLDKRILAFCITSLNIIIILTLASNTGCKASSREIVLSFETIENQDWPGDGQPYEALEPVLMVISQKGDLEDLGKVVTDTAIQRLQTVNYDDYFALIIFQGRKPTGGYGVQIDRIVKIDNSINIYTQFREPKPEDAKTDEVTSPYQLVQVEKSSGDWNREINLHIIVGGENILSLSHFIP